MHRPDDYLVQELVQKSLVTIDDVARARESNPDGDLVGELVKMGAVSSRDAALTRAVVCETPYVDLARYDISLTNAELLPRALVDAHALVEHEALAAEVAQQLVGPVDRHGLVEADVDPAVKRIAGDGGSGAAGESEEQHERAATHGSDLPRAERPVEGKYAGPGERV